MFAATSCPRQAWAWHPLRIALALALCLAAWMAAVGRASAAEPLYQLDPYDQITLNKDNDDAVLKVRTLDLPERQVPKQPDPQEKLKVRLLDQPDKEFEVQWKAIVKVELFEQMVLGEASQLVTAGKLDEAYDYFAFLQEKYPKMPGLEPALEGYLFEEAKSLTRKGQFDAALSRLREINHLNPQRPGLSNALGFVADKLCAKYQAADNYPAIRALLTGLAALVPEHPTVTSWQSRLKEQAAALAVEARKALAEGRLRDADRSGRKLVEVWPATAGLKELLASVTAKYPRVVVGVTEPAIVPRPEKGDSPPSPQMGTVPFLLPGSLQSWAARRSSRLVYRTLMEFQGPGSDGGKYFCPMGEMGVEELGLRLRFELKRGLRWSSGPGTLSGYDLSRRLLAMADPGDPAYRIQWAEIFAGVSVDRVYDVRVDLRRPHVRPEALLQCVVAPSRDPGSDLASATNGPYVLDASSPTGATAGLSGSAAANTGGQVTRGALPAGEAVYTANAAYFAARPSQPKEIVERCFPAASDGIKALRRGQIDVLDRVNPWEVDKVAAIPDVVIEPYAVPLVHCLLPNLQRPLVGSRTFRRALVYGIQRKAILNAMTGGKERPGCQLISGPFSPGVARDDPLDYAYDRSIDPRGYDPRLAIGLAEVAFRELAEAKKKQGQTLKKMPPLVLAYPADAIARLAAGAIKKQLALLGILVNLEELPAGVPAGLNDKIDLLYAELAMWEPVVDARRLLDRDGLAGSCSPYMSLALKQLEEAADWPTVGLKLRQIHQLAHSEVAVVPLWQLTDFFAYRRSLSGVGSRPVTLYQHVESWKVQSRDPTEEEKR
jgi:ABC-type transport system substrate-binding protein/tetratricopeptide (TPR) repeat protein